MDRPLTIVYVSYGIDSYLHRTFPVARLAATRGHRFVMMTARSSGIRRIESEGIEAVHLVRQEELERDRPRPPQWPTPAGRVLQKLPALEYGPRKKTRSYAQQRRKILLDTAELLSALEDLAPDIVLTEAEMHRDIRVIRGAGYPLMIMDDFYGSRQSSSVPPSSSSYIPKRRLMGRLVSGAAWASFNLKQRVRHMAAGWWLRGQHEDAVLDELGPHSGSKGIFQRFHYDPVPVVRRLPGQLMFPGEAERGFTCGPILDLDRSDDAVDEDFADRWPEVLRRCTQPSGPSLVVISPGTLQKGATLTSAAVAGLGGDPRFEVLIATPAAAPPAGPLPANVHWFQRVPMPTVLEQASLAMGTGGTAFMHESLWFGVPLVFVNGGSLDQPGNIARAVHHRVAVRLPVRRLTGNRLADAAAGVLNDSGFTSRAQDISQAFRANEGPTALLDAIEHTAQRAAVGG